MADKKISELPLLNSVSGSSIVVPIVHDGTTNKLNLSQLAHYTSQFSAKTGSANTFTGNQTIVGNLVVSGDLTAERYYIETISSSVIYESGSTVFGNSGDDTHTFTGSIILNGATIGAAQLNSFTASQLAVNLGISSVTGSINTTTASFDLVFLGISSVSGAINTTTSSFDSVFLGISSVTGAINTQSSSQDLVNRGISSTTGSINTTTSSFDSVFSQIGQQTASQDLVNLGISSVTGSLIGITNTLMGFTASLDNTYATDAQLYQLYQATASIHFATQSLNYFYAQTSSQDLVNLGISTYTGSQNVINTSVDSHILKQSIQTGSQDLVNLGISTYTGSQNEINSSVDAHILKQAIQTGSQDLVNLGISSVTGSLTGITNGLMAFTAALDSTYATDAQLYQLYQATASIHFATQSLNTQTGSQDLVNLGISSVTGSLIGITNGLMAFTAALDSTYATDAQLYQLYQATASIHFGTQSLNTQTGSQDLVNLGISTFTGSLRSEVNLIEAYTASLKSAAIVSSSTQIQNYNLFAQTSSANTFWGNQTFDTTTLFVDSVNHRVGIKTITPSRDLDINGDTTILGNNYVATNKFFQFEGGVYFTLRTANSGNTLQFYRGDDASVPMAINSNNGVNFDGAVTASNFKVPSGGGLDFSATSNGSGTMTSELLNDYEEGTWTGTLKGSVSDPTTAVTATGYYTKVGNKVFATIDIHNVTTTGASGNVSVSGLPFTSAATNNAHGSVMCAFYDFDGGTSLIALIGASSTSVFIMTSGDDADWNDLLHTAGSGRSLRFSITYFV